MREAEYAATMASLVDSSYEYPKKVGYILERKPGNGQMLMWIAIRCGMGGYPTLSIPRRPARKWYRYGQYPCLWSFYLARRSSNPRARSTKMLKRSTPRFESRSLEYSKKPTISYTNPPEPLLLNHQSRKLGNYSL